MRLTYFHGLNFFPSWKTFVFIFLFFATISIIIYSPSLHGDFVFDDTIIKGNYNSIIHITSVSQLTDLLFSKEHSRRIGLMSFSLNYYFGRLDPFGYHMVNVIIHILNGLILFLLSYNMLTLSSVDGKVNRNAFKIAFLGSLLWLVHPIQTQAVSYIVQRLTSLTALFFLLSLLFYIKGRVLKHARKCIAFFILSFGFGFLALGTKENAAILPLFIILTEFLFFQKRPFEIDKNKLGFIVLFGGLFILIAGVYLGPDFITTIAEGYEKGGWTPFERILTQLRVVVLYLSLLIYPHPSRLNVDHDISLSTSLFTPLSTFFSLLLIIGSLIPAIFLWRKHPLVSFAIFWFFGNLIIESSIIPLELVFEHRVYLPSMGFIILVFGLCFSFLQKDWQKWAIGLMIPLILLFSYWTYERAFVWKGPLALWTDALKKSPYKTRPHANLGYVYENMGMLDEAISECKKALSINPNCEFAYTSLGNVYTKQGKLDEAISKYKKALSLNPNYSVANYNLGNAYTKQGKLDEAISEYKKALSLNPNYSVANYNLGNAYTKQGKLDEAISEYKKALSIKPDLIEAYSNLGIAYANKGRLDEAISACKKALVINPDFVATHINLSLFYYEKRDYQAAITHCDKAIELGLNANSQLIELLNPYR